MQKTITPIDNTLYIERNYDGAKIEETINGSMKAQKMWADLDIKERVKLLTSFVEDFLSRSDLICEELSRQIGRPISQAAGELKGFKERADYMLSIAEKKLANTDVAKDSNFKSYIKRKALGVVFVIAPWNYPYLVAVNSIIPAMAAGNSVILKHSAQTPLCAEQLYQSAKKILPKDIFNYLHLNHEDSLKIVSDKRINFVSFTGSVKAGYDVQKATQNKFIDMTLELGGKDPAYIRADADLDYAIESTVDGAFFNSGQSCCGLERIYVHESVYDAYVAGFVALTKAFNLGRSDDQNTTLGPMVRASAADFVRQQIVEALDQGAEAHIDPKAFLMDQPGSPYMAPQVLTQVDHRMRVMTEESFGPVVGIMKVANDEEAIGLMNDSDLGLSAAIFTQDIDTGMALGDRIETGTFFINRCDYLDPALAWTGVKNTGRGCTLSSLGFEAVTQPKSYHIKIKL